MELPESLRKAVENYLAGTATPQEKQQVNDWYHSFSKEQVEVVTEMSRGELHRQMLRNIREAIRAEGSGKKITPVVPLWRRPLVAAAILVLCIGIVLLYTVLKKEENGDPAGDPGKSGYVENDIRPGGNRAILTLSDGSAIVLDSAATGLLTRQGGADVVKADDGVLRYHTGKDAPPAAIAYNTITTPKGGKYQVLLPDGSRVWLNAASSLKFPATFTGAVRNVELSGEGYFEVTRDVSKPFLVKLSQRDMEVEVLGTSFNIMGYRDEPQVRTTLLEGSVKVKRNEGAVRLKPGEQLQVDSMEKSARVVRLTETEEAIAWKNDLFYFDRVDLETIMRQIERWYDVEVRYEKNIIKRSFVGRVRRSAEIADVLGVLELGGIHFRMEGRVITVLQ